MYLPRQVLWYQQLASGSSTCVPAHANSGGTVPNAYVSEWASIGFVTSLLFCSEENRNARVHVCNSRNTRVDGSRDMSFVMA